MTRLFLSLVFLMFLSSSPFAQGKYWIFGQNLEERASTRIGYWHKNVNAGLGEVVVSYGRPVWKEEYSKKLDEMTKGKMWRMGSNYWTLLDANIPFEMGQRKVDVGFYYLAVRRSEDGKRWELLFIDHEKSRRKALDAYDVGTRPEEIPVQFSVPLQFRKSDEIVEKLTILLSLNEGSETEGTLRLSWGDFELSTGLRIHLP